MEQGQPPKGFITVNDAIALIQSDSRKDATVDVAFLVRNLPWLEKNRNYTIKLLRHENGKVVENGVKTVFISNDYEKEMLKHAIITHYTDLSGRSIDPDTIGIRKISTAVDAENNPQGRPMINKDSTTKIGDSIISEERISEE